MKANNYISRKEHILLLIFALIIFVLALSSFVSSYNEEVNESQTELEGKAGNNRPSLAVDASSDYRPTYRFQNYLFTFFLFLAILNAKKFLVSVFFTSVPFLIYIYWFFKINEDIKLTESYMSGTPHLLKIATFYDYFVFLFVSILLFWQISILLRMLVSKSQRKNKLP